MIHWLAPEENNKQLFDAVDILAQVGEYHATFYA